MRLVSDAYQCVMCSSREGSSPRAMVRPVSMARSSAASIAPEWSASNWSNSLSHCARGDACNWQATSIAVRSGLAGPATGTYSALPVGALQWRERSTRLGSRHAAGGVEDASHLLGDHGDGVAAHETLVRRLHLLLLELWVEHLQSNGPQEVIELIASQGSAGKCGNSVRPRLGACRPRAQPANVSRFATAHHHLVCRV